MRKPGIRFLLILPFAVISIILLTSHRTDAGKIDRPLAATIESLRPDEQVPVIITLSDRADLSHVHDRDKKKKRKEILMRLRQIADATQGDLKSLLQNRRARKIKPLWIVNGIAATVPVSLITEIEDLPGIESVTLDSTIQAPVVTAGGPALPEWNISAIKAPDVWNRGFTGSGVVVATMDTGVDMHHPDLQARWRGGANSWYDPNGEHATPEDTNGHGTQAMGIIVGGAAGGSAIGVAPGAEWIGVKIFNDAGTASLSAIHQGFQWLLNPDNDPNTDDAPDVVSNSWGIEGANNCSGEFVSDIQTLRNADIAVVFSAGNYGPNSSTSMSPSNNAGAFSVGAVDSNYLVASFSSRGPSSCDGSVFPQLTAPGVDIRTSDLTYGGAFPDSYITVSGTSFAAPHVAGAIALLMNAFPAVSASDIELALDQSSLDMGVPGSDNDYGFGVMDVLHAYNLLKNGSGVPSADVFPLSYGFGDVMLGQTSQPGVFTVTNKGTGSLVLDSLSLSGLNYREFQISNDKCSGKTLGPQEMCTAQVIFSPVSAGLKSAALSVPSNDPLTPTISISLSATGFAPPPLTVVSPNGGETWVAGTTQTIRWQYTGNPGYYAKIELLKNGVVNRTITTYASMGANGAGTYNWVIPSTQASGTDYAIRVSSSTNAAYQDISNGAISIGH